MGKLTALRCRTVKEPGRYPDGDNLWLQVRSAEHKSWLFRFTRNGQARAMGLGPFPAVTLAEARQKAADARRMLAAGVDPLTHKRAARGSSVTFKEVAELYLASHRTGWRSKRHAIEWLRSLEIHALPTIGGMPVGAVDTATVMRVLEPIWRQVPETASRVRGRIEAVLDFAKTRGWRAGENPARWRGHLMNLLPASGKVAAVRHFAAIPYINVPGVVRELREQQGLAARALEFCILTATRTGEVLGARWGEFDFGTALWIIPGNRTKAGREHRVPFAAPTFEILQQLPRLGDLVFPGRQPDRQLHFTAMLRVLERMGRRDHCAWAPIRICGLGGRANKFPI